MTGRTRGREDGGGSVWLASTPSTNDEVRRRWAAGFRGAERFPHLCSVATLWQTGGRGRHGRQWISPRGACLAVSTLLRLDAAGPARGALGWLPLLAQLALRDALLPLLGAQGPARLRIKWPNDLLLDGGKVSGVLGEVLGESDGELACVVGTGVNVLLRPEELPFPGAASLLAAGVPDPDPAALLEPYLARFAGRVEALEAHAWDAVAAGLRAEMLEACVTIGQRVRVGLPGGAGLTGTAIGIAPGGELLLRDAEGRERTVAAGEVERLRSA
ncbi:MAG: biotin--[acetyl-CoA-carboxylase] ligase [Pseudoclavibacter sp.]|nr:biotin--[acetyl-CoA-carboxylase] ligase [Pseudoclavibacter sp.]